MTFFLPIFGSSAPFFRDQFFVPSDGGFISLMLKSRPSPPLTPRLAINSSPRGVYFASLFLLIQFWNFNYFLS